MRKKKIQNLKNKNSRLKAKISEKDNEIRNLNETIEELKKRLKTHEFWFKFLLINELWTDYTKFLIRTVLSIPGIFII